ncbi:hypothetical protein PM082_009518 [Marasmius tenuissimus]|nr:hypothetical protein PM082_009518 [Marasmius tenuissimus]
MPENMPRNTSSPQATEDLDDWIGTNRKFKDSLKFVQDELRRCLCLSSDTLNLLPPDTLSIQNLLLTPLPSIAGAVVFTTPASWFFSAQPTNSISCLLNHPIPAKPFIDGLYNAAGQAMLNGKVSICVGSTPERRTILVSFEGLALWAALTEAITCQKKWTTAVQWLDGVILKKPELQELGSHTRQFLGQVQWKEGVEGLQSTMKMTDMSTFLSNSWLNNGHVDAMLCRLSMRLSALPSLSHTNLIAPCSLSVLLSSSPYLKATGDVYNAKAPQDLLKFGTKLASSGAKSLWTVVHIPGHWVAMKISMPERHIHWSDSFRGPVPKKIKAVIKSWLYQHLPSKQFSFQDLLECAHQGDDTHSCGIIAVNTLKHQLFGDNLWEKKSRESLRIREFNDIVGYLLSITRGYLEPGPLADLALNVDGLTACETCNKGKPVLNSPPTCVDTTMSSEIIVTGLDFAEITLSNDSDAEMIVSKVPAASLPSSPLASSSSPPALPSSSPAPSSSPILITTPEPATSGILLRFDTHVDCPVPPSGPPIHHFSKPQKRKLSIDGPIIEQPPKKPRGQGKPRTETRSRSANAVHVLNDAVRAGTFSKNETKWASYVEKLRAYDAEVEVNSNDPTQARHVRHSACGEWLQMKTVYDVSYFKLHVEKRCNKSKPAGNTRTLDIRMGVIKFTPSSVAHEPLKPQEESSKKPPCMGLTVADDPRIPNYISRTAILSAGGDDIHTIAIEMFSRPYSKLSQEDKDSV